MRKISVTLIIIFTTFFGLQGFARGKNIIPQLADGSNIRTKLDLINVSDVEFIGNFDLNFVHQDGTPWVLTIKSNGQSKEGSRFPLNLAPRETLRIETAGLSSPTTSGYAYVEDNEPRNTSSSRDFVLGITVFYEIHGDSGIVDTVSVPVNDPISLGVFPVEIEQDKDLYTGMAVVNLAGSTNRVSMTLFSASGANAGSANFTFEPGEQRAEFLNQKLFPSLKSFKGMVEFSSVGPIALLALLQTRTANSVQYATLAPTNKEMLRRNSYMWLPQATDPQTPFMPLDVDAPLVDYFREGRGEDGYSWDITYEWETKSTNRSLTFWNGAVWAKLGQKDADAFDALSMVDMRALTYSNLRIDLSDGAEALNIEHAFAVKTDLGSYAKIRIVRIFESRDDQGNIFKDLGLEIYVYR